MAARAMSQKETDWNKARISAFRHASHMPAPFSEFVAKSASEPLFRTPITPKTGSSSHA